MAGVQNTGGLATSNPSTIEVAGLAVPRLLYGTAWKKEDSTRLTALALAQGFRGIDTANQRRHYYEAEVGAAVQAALAAGQVRRDELFLQTKFTSRPGQDHRLPYDPEAPPARQVEQSFLSSLEHLGVERLDSYVLHGPSSRYGWTGEDREVWQAMEALQRAGKTRLLGVSNVSAAQLAALIADAAVPPSFVQNRCFAAAGWDREVRQICQDRGVVYQGFSLLTANPQVLAHARVRGAAARTGRTVAQVVLRLALHLGMVALTGTTNPTHMRQDLEISGFALEPDEVRELEGLFG